MRPVFIPDGFNVSDVKCVLMTSNVSSIKTADYKLYVRIQKRFSKQIAFVSLHTSKSSCCLRTVSRSSPTGSSLSASRSALRKKLSTEVSRSSQSWSLCLRSLWSLLEASSSLKKNKHTARLRAFTWTVELWSGMKESNLGAASLYWVANLVYSENKVGFWSEYVQQTSKATTRI